MNSEVLEKAVLSFNEYREPDCRAEIFKVDSFRLFIRFSGSAGPKACCSDEHIVDFLSHLNKVTGNQYDIVRLFRASACNLVAVFVPDNDRMKEVVDFGFAPFDLLL